MDIIPFLEIINRTKTGSQVTKNNWDMEYVVLPVQQIVKRYHLTWDKTNPIPQDDDLIDRLFQAGLELAYSSGVYCISGLRGAQYISSSCHGGRVGR